MSTNKSIFYILCNNGIIINLYKLHFPSFPFFLQPNKIVFHPPTFLPLQPNKQEGKLNIFYPPTFPSSHNFPSSHFYTPPSKRTLKQSLVLARCQCLIGSTLFANYVSSVKSYNGQFVSYINRSLVVIDIKSPLLSLSVFKLFLFYFVYCEIQ